ncbi:hypothetical protein AAC387_Pa03g0419 [Persea americana]
MAIDQSSIPKDLRPLNLNRAAVEDPPAAEGFFPGPPFRTVCYPVAASDAGVGMLGFGNASSAAARAPPPSAAANRPAAEPAGGDDGGAEDSRSRKVKFLCSFGGKILPRPSDGALRYVGGQTRIISVRRDVGFQELLQKMVETCGQLVGIKYQLPDEDLDALVSVSCPEDLENMMEEYEKLAENSSDGSAKLRVFLFSQSDVDPSGAVQFGDLSDSGQRYVDAVNGIPDSAGGIRRKGSMASMSSTQNSDGLMSGGEAGESSGGQVDFFDGASPTVLSPTDVASSAGQDTGRLVYMPPSSALIAEPVQLNLPPIATGRPQKLSSAGSESESERSVPTTGQPLPVYNFPPPTVDYRPVTTYMQSYSDFNQDVFNRVDYMHHSTQIGYMNPQSMGPVRQVYRLPPEQPQQVPSHQFVPMVHATVAPTSPRLSVKPMGGGQQFVQLQQMRVEPYLEEGSMGGRVVQLPADQSYKAFQSQAQSPGLHAGQTFEHYNWRQVPPVPPPDHVICTSPQPHQQGVFPVSPEKTSRSEDCYMCHKGLPHVHSDSLLQEHVNPGIAKTISDCNAILQSHHSDESVRSRLASRVGVVGTEAPREPHNERPLGVEATTLGLIGSGIRPKFIGHIEPSIHEVTAPNLVSYGFSQGPELQHNNERILVQKAENPDYPRTLHPLGVAGFPVDGQASYGMFMGNLPQSPQEVVLQQPAASSQYQVKQETMPSKTVGTDIPTMRSVPFQTSEPSLPGQNHVFVPKEDILDVSCDHLRPIDGRMEALRISPPEIPGIAEHYRPQNKPNTNVAKDVKPENVLMGAESGIRVTEPITLSNVNIAREEIPDNRDQIAGKEMYMTNALINPGVIQDGNLKGQTDPFPPSLQGASLHNFQPEESNLAMGNAGAYQHVRVGIDPSLPSEMWHGKPAFSYIDSTATPGEWKDEASRFHSRRVFNDVAAPANSNAPFSALNAGPTNALVVDSLDPPVPSNSLFSNQDPWKLRHDMHIPPKVPKVASREILVPRDSNGENRSGSSGELGMIQIEEGTFRQPSDGLNKDSCSETGQSVKGSAEEQIKKELKAVAEGVAASVLQSSTPPLPSFSGRERNESSAEPNQDGVHQYEEETQNTVAQGIKNKFLDKASPSLTPTADGISRLQIIKNSDLEELRELGSGTFGTVYHGKWRGTDVAIKRITDRCFAGKPSEQERMRDDFWNEACKLADLHHPNVVAFYGVVLDGPGGSVATVTEYMVNGSLRHALQRNDKTLDYRKRLLIAMDVAFGMEYLHGKNIVHFDLKSDNLLVNLRDPHRPICKVGDLGLSKVKCQTLISGGVRGTLPWMAPELLNGSSSLVSEKVDVFSFGIVMWELLTGEEPYADLHYGAIIGGIVSNTLRPPIPENCDPEWRSLMEKCWSSEPSERPSFTEIANALRLMAASLPPKGQVQHQHPTIQSQTHK